MSDTSNTPFDDLSPAEQQVRREKAAQSLAEHEDYCAQMMVEWAKTRPLDEASTGEA